MQLASSRLGGGVSLLGVPAQARDIRSPAVRLHLHSAAPAQSGTVGVPQHTPHAPSKHQHPHAPTIENNALLWREVPSPQSQQHSPLQQHHHLPEAEFNKLLNKEITACRSWRHLRALLHAHAQSMNSIHVSALVSRLAKVAPFTPATGFSEDMHSSSSTSPPLHNLGAVAVADAAAPQTSSGSRSPNAVERRALDHFMGEVSQLVSSRLDTFDARALSNVLWAVAKLGFCPSHGLLQRFLFAAYVSMQDMQPQEVANLAWALATMRIHPGAPWTCRLLDRISAAAGCMRPQELAHCTWAIQQLLEAHCDAQQQLEYRREQQQQQQQHGSQARGVGKPTVASTSPAYSALEVCYLGALHAIQQSAERALEGFKARELMMLLLSLHRMRQRLVLGQVSGLQGKEGLQSTQQAALQLVGQAQGVPPLLLQHAGGQQARSMMASHHRLLVAALQSPQLTVHLSTLSPLDVSNLAGLVARDVKLQQQAARQGTLFHTWHLIYEQRAIGQLARAVVADSQARMEQYAPQDLLGLVTALSAMQAVGLPRAWLSACAHRIGTTLLALGDSAAASSKSHLSGARSSASSIPADSPCSTVLSPRNISSSGSSRGSVRETASAAEFPGYVGGVDGPGGLGCLSPGADPKQHACAHATLASLLCCLAKCAARAGAPMKSRSSASGSGSSDGISRENTVRERSSGGFKERSRIHDRSGAQGISSGSRQSRSNSEKSKEDRPSSSCSIGDIRESDLAVRMVASDGSSSGSWSCREVVAGPVDLEARRTLVKCLRAALPRMEMRKLAVVAWSLAELKGPWSQQLLAALQQRMQQLLLPFLQPPAASDTTIHPLPLGLSEVSMLLWGVERLQLQLDASTARALAQVTASVATAAVGSPVIERHVVEAGRPAATPLAQKPTGASDAGADHCGDDGVGAAVGLQVRVRPVVGAGRPAATPLFRKHAGAAGAGADHGEDDDAGAACLHTSDKHIDQAPPTVPRDATAAHDLTKDGRSKPSTDGMRGLASHGKHQAMLQAASTSFVPTSNNSSSLHPQPVHPPSQTLPSRPTAPNTAARMSPRSAPPPRWNTISAPASAAPRTASTAGIRQPPSALSATTTGCGPQSASPLPKDSPSGGGHYQASSPLPHGSLPSSTMPNGCPSGGGLHKVSPQASHPSHQPIPMQAPSHAHQTAVTPTWLHTKRSMARTHSFTAPMAGTRATKAAVAAAAAGHSRHSMAGTHSFTALTADTRAIRAAEATAAASVATAPAVPRGGSSSGRLTGFQDLAWAASSLCTLQARCRVHIWRDTTKEVLEQALTSAARSLHSQQLCTLVLALGQAQAHPSEHLLAALLQRSLHLLPTLGPTHMSRLLCGLARLGYQPPPLWLAHTLSHTQALLPGCSIEEASWMLWALAKLHVVLPSAWVRTWHQHLLAHALYAQHSPRAAVRAAWALHALRLKLPDHSHALLVQAAAQSGEHLSREEALWLLRVAVGWQQYLEHKDWGRLLLGGVLQGQPPAVAVAEMPLRQQHILLSCMAHRHMRWTRCWDEWREVHRALGGRHTAGASGLVGIWRRTTRPRRWERRLWAHTSKTQRRKQRHLLTLTWEAYKATKPRQLCSIWRFLEKHWDK